MTTLIYRPEQLRHYARVVMVLFALSVINMGFQVPVHAAMMQQAMSSDMAQGMMVIHHETDKQPDNSDCCCPPSICESVDAQHNQLTPASVSILSIDFEQHYPVLVIILQDTQARSSGLSFENSNWQYRQFSPPPIQFTTELQI